MIRKKEKTTSPELRKKVILEVLKDHDFISIQEILEKLNASEITVRRDLLDLEKKGLLIRAHGGAVKKAMADHLFTYNNKVNQNRENKDYICRIASGFIKPNDIIFIDCGSTLSFLPNYLSKISPLTVISNSLPIISELINFDHIKSILIGGEVDNKRRAVYGRSAINSIAQYHANKAFIGADGISLSKGVTSYEEKIASVTLQMIENSDEVFLLADSSKIEKNSFAIFAPLSVVDYIITDQNADPSLVSKYENHGVRLFCNDLKSVGKAVMPE